MTSSASALRAYVTETKYETVRMLRSPSFSGVFLTIPVLVYMLFGVVLFGTQLRSDPKAAIAVFSGFSVFGIMGPALFGFGVTIAIEREQGLLRLKQALPMPAGAHIAAKLVMSMLFAAVIMGTMEVAGLTLAHLSLSTGQLLAMALLNIVGVLPFCALGLFIGTLVKGNTAPGLTNVIYLPMIYLSGLFFPLPHSMMLLAPIWPAYHLNQLVLSAAGLAATGSMLVHSATLITVTLLFALFAVKRLRIQN